MKSELPATQPAQRKDDVPSILREMDRNEFTLAVKRAEAEAMSALEARDAMLLWARRLQPYFDRDPHMTVAEALQRYDSTTKHVGDENCLGLSRIGAKRI